jgi:ligand-binding SRPBCC domain-containing protein
MAQQFETSQWVPFPVELVFAFFTNPSNLPLLMPPRLEIRVEDARLQAPRPRPVSTDPERRFRGVAAGEGSEILISFYPMRWFPRRVSWLTRITEFEWNSHFCDEQVSGPFSRFHHRHGITAEVRGGQEGTLVIDSIEFALPGGPIGQLGMRIVLRLLEQSFACRQERLPEVLKAAARQAARRA